MAAERPRMKIMVKKEEQWNAKEEELQATPPEDVGAEIKSMKDEREAIEAMRKFTNEDDDDLGEISVKSILGGDFLMSRFMMKQIVFVMFCVLLMILYTGNRYDSQQDAILIDSLRGALQDVKYNVLTQSSELMNLTRQSNVEKMLSGTPDSLLHNSITPPYLIKGNDHAENANENQVEEVLVGAEVVDEMEEEDKERMKEGQKKEETEKQEKEVQAKEPDGQVKTEEGATKQPAEEAAKKQEGEPKKTDDAVEAKGVETNKLNSEKNKKQ